jgi:molybdopterin/thiamine biosynthesis adenylyltransferase/rhodanese-related sulfurtransferase
MGEFTPEELARYRRQITLAGFGMDGQRRLRDAHVAVLGAGGLGSPALIYLATAGVGEVTVIDDDTVETSNLHRQVIHTDDAVGESKATSARREILARNPSVTVHTVTDRLTAGNAVDLLGQADIVLDGTDNLAARYACSHGCAVLGIPHVWASILGFDAQLSVFGATWADGTPGPIYEDVFPVPPPSGSVPSCSAAGVLGPVVGVVGTAMALEAVKVLAGIGEPLIGSLGYFDGLSGRWEYIPVTADPSVAARVQDAPTPIAEDFAVEPSDEGPSDVNEIIPDLASAVLVDVREPDEFSTVHIPGAVNVPLSVLKNGVPESVTALAGDAADPGDTESSLVVYCAAGVRSAQAVEILEASGINAVSYPGGINAWLDAQ